MRADKIKTIIGNINDLPYKTILFDGTWGVGKKLPEESRTIGRWGRMHQVYLQEHRPGQYNELLLSGKLWTPIPIS